MIEDIRQRDAIYNSDKYLPDQASPDDRFGYVFCERKEGEEGDYYENVDD